VGVIYYQLHFIQTKDLGLDGSYVALVNLRDREAWRLRDHLHKRLLAHPAIHNATVAQAVPGQFQITLGLKPEELSTQIETGPACGYSQKAFLSSTTKSISAPVEVL
jgi:hypothetical protein